MMHSPCQGLSVLREFRLWIVSGEETVLTALLVDSEPSLGRRSIGFSSRRDFNDGRLPRLHDEIHSTTQFLPERMMQRLASRDDVPVHL